MTTPVPPRIRSKTAAEKAADQKRREIEVAEEAAHAAANQRPASPYELVSEALFKATSDAIFAAIGGPDFAGELRRLGLVVVPVCPTVPDAPQEWMHAGIDLMGYASSPIDVLTDLWEQAYRAGWEACSATAAETTR